MTQTTDSPRPDPTPEPPPLPSPRAARDRLLKLSGVHQRTLQHHRALLTELQHLRQALAIAGGVARALDTLSQELFGDIVHLLEDKLTIALQEVLEQPISLQVTSRYLRGSAAIEFSILRKGQPEHIMKGQGGSVANILSVGLRMFALTTLDPKLHRRFLILDEQDCWLHPSLVPRMVKIIHDAGKALGFQVILISHHDWRAFEQHADKIYRFQPTRGGYVRASSWAPGQAGKHPTEEAPTTDDDETPP